MQLITTQLIEEYQKEVDRLNEKKNLSNDREVRICYKTKILTLMFVIERLQSKQSEERQNIVDAVDDAINTTLNSNSNIVLTGEDYFNQTFKQEQK